MKAVTVQGEHYIVLVPEANITLVLTKQEFVDSAQRAKAWKPDVTNSGGSPGGRNLRGPTRGVRSMS